MNSAPVLLSAGERQIVMSAIRDVCARRDWVLHAAHVRANHVHAVVTAGDEPEFVMGKLKTISSRFLNRAFEDLPNRWSRHGSTRWLWDPNHVNAAVHYVVYQPGRPLELYVNPTRWDDTISGRDDREF